MDWHVANRALALRCAARVVNFDGKWHAVIQIGNEYASTPVDLNKLDVDATLKALLTKLQDEPEIVPMPTKPSLVLVR